MIHEPNGDSAEWAGLFRMLRNKARTLINGVTSPTEFVSLVDAVETIASMDPSFPSVTVHELPDEPDDQPDESAPIRLGSTE